MKKRYRSKYIFTLIFACTVIVSGISCLKKVMTQEKAIKAVQSLEEVQRYTIQLRGKNSRPFIKEESHDDKSAEFSVGESLPTHTVLWNRFSINKENGNIFIFDIESGDYISIEKWRGIK